MSWKCSSQRVVDRMPQFLLRRKARADLFVRYRVGLLYLACAQLRYPAALCLDLSVPRSTEANLEKKTATPSESPKGAIESPLGAGSLSADNVASNSGMTARGSLQTSRVKAACAHRSGNLLKLDFLAR